MNAMEVRIQVTAPEHVEISPTAFADAIGLGIPFIGFSQGNSVAYLTGAEVAEDRRSVRLHLELPDHVARHLERLPPAAAYSIGWGPLVQWLETRQPHSGIVGTPMPATDAQSRRPR